MTVDEISDQRASAFARVLEGSETLVDNQSLSEVLGALWPDHVVPNTVHESQPFVIGC